VLIDEGGITSAEALSIERLIADIEKDRATLELVANIGSAISSLGGGATSIANWKLDSLTDVVASEIVGPLKAAKLIMQLAVNVKKAADRAILLSKFKTDLQRSKTAVSSLSSTIEGFVNNKIEQIAFRTVEDALLAVQAASAILGSIPEPFTLAVGKTMSAFATAAQEGAKLTEMIYTKQKLEEAWAKTKAAMENPRDRSLGLAALRLNPTLGMHAVAWAGMEKSPPDPIARMFLDSVGLNEQTLAVSGTEKKVRQYLETLLNEDRRMVDSSKINTNWAPETYTLCTKDWFVITSRAQRDAVPKLRAGDEKGVLQALKMTDKHQLKKLESDARKCEVSFADLNRCLKEVNELCQALDAYQPKNAEDGAEHVEMSSITDEFLKYAAEHKAKLREIVAIRKSVDAEYTFKLLEGDSERFSLMFGEKGDDPVDGLSTDMVKEAVTRARKMIEDVQSRPKIAEDERVARELETLSEWVEKGDIWIRLQDFASPPVRPRTRRRSGANAPQPVKN
jgi:hypothetical protein